MAEVEINIKYRRRPSIALMLSLIMPGLGHIYCGRIVKGLVFVLLNSIPFLGLLFTYASIGTITLLIMIFVSFGIFLTAIIDSYYIAKHTRLDYELKDYNRWYVYVLLIILSTFSSKEAALNFKNNYLEAFRMSTSSSMYPTIAPQDRFLVDKILYKKENPKRGDVVVFISPDNRNVSYIKRIVAVAGDTVEMKNNELYINCKKLERAKTGQLISNGPKHTEKGQVFIENNGQTEYKIFLADVNYAKEQGVADFAEITVPKNYCFVLGDNRNNSWDSRNFGPIPLATIKGKAEYIYWPAKDWSDFGKIQ